MDIEKGHGEVGKVGGADTAFNPFTKLLPSRPDGYDFAKLGALASGMVTEPDGLSDGPDPEENLFVPAGYTYFGQFIDHDLTLDTTSTLNPDDLKDPDRPLDDPTNLRSPRFDLDCVYGNGPADQPYMFAGADDARNGIHAGASMLIDEHDLARAGNGRAIIGDKRNDENSIVNQIQQTFIRFHNKVVSELAARDAKLRGGDLFRKARDEVRWAYQRVILDDFLPRIVEPAVLDHFKQSGAYELYPRGPLRRNLPREFVAAAYRFGHSGVRTGYRLNGDVGPDNGKILPIFTNPPKPDVVDSLVGFDPLPASHVIDHWSRFFPSDTPVAGARAMSNAGETLDLEDDGTGGNGAVRLQYAYKLDPTIADPLANLPPKIAPMSDVQPPALQVVTPKSTGPSLALLNLLRGNRYRLQGGQRYAAAIGVDALHPKYLCVRHSKDTDEGKRYFFQPIAELGDGAAKIGTSFDDDTPLWFYILAEAQRPLVDFWYEHGQQDLTEEHLKGLDVDGKPYTTADPGAPADALAGEALQQLKDTRCAGTQLGGVGGRMVVEVFHGLMESDPDSVLTRHRNDGWTPVWGAGPATMTKLLRYVDPSRAP